MPVFNNQLAGAAGSGGSGDFVIQKSLRFNPSDTPKLSRTPSSSGNRTTWTFSCWFKRFPTSSRDQIISATVPGAYNGYIEFQNDRFMYEEYGSGQAYIKVETNRIFRDPGAWVHACVAVDTSQNLSPNRVRIFINGVQETSLASATYGQQNFGTSFNHNAEHKFGQFPGNQNFPFDGLLAEVHMLDGITPGTATDDASGSVTGTPNAVYLTDFGEFNSTTGVWDPKQYSGSHGQNGFYLDFSDQSSDSALGYDAAGSNNFTVTNFKAAGKAPETFTVLGNQSNSGNSNSVNVSSLGTVSSTAATYWDPDGNTYNHLTVDFGSVGEHNIMAGPFLNDPGANITVYKSNDGSSWTQVSKGQNPYNFTGRYLQWARSGSGYGAQTLRSPSTLPQQDVLVDSPSNYEASSGNHGGNYAHLNVLHKSSTNQGDYTNGCLQFTRNGSGYATACSNIGMFSGKWYCEVTKSGTGTNSVIGVHDLTRPTTYLDATDRGAGWRSDGTRVYNNTAYSNIGAYTNTDVMGLAFDADAGTLYFYKNGTQVGTFGGLSMAYAPYHFAFSAYDSQTLTVNFGAHEFTHAPPTGYKPLGTYYFDDPAVVKGSDAFEAKTYTGNGGTQTISLPFSPDCVWVKNRSSTADHEITSTVMDANKAVASNLTAAQFNTVIEPGTDSFYLDGNSIYANNSGHNYISWNWNGGGSSTTVNADANGSGLPGATCTYRANAAAGISFVKVDSPNSTEARVHGLGKKPKFFICFSTASADSKHVYHDWYGRSFYWNINDTAGASSSDQFGTSNPDSTYFRVKPVTGSGANKAGGMFYMVFTDVEQFSRFGYYKGNGSADGPYVYLGFEPRLILYKEANTGGEHWHIRDTARSPMNLTDDRLMPSTSAAEGSGSSFGIDILSNGFKIRHGNDTQNFDNNTYIYAAFGKHPLKYGRGF